MVRDKNLFNVPHVVLFRQGIEMKHCSAYGQVKYFNEIPGTSEHADHSETYEVVGERDGVYEKI